MNPLVFEYKVDLREYHTAVYFGLVNRYRTALLIFLAVATAALLCTAGAALGLFPLFMLPAYLFLGYLVWLLILLGRAEHGILKLAKRPDSPLGRTMRMTFGRDTLRIETPGDGGKAVHPFTRLFLVFELSNLFMIYLDPANVLLLPARVMTGGQRAELRELLREALHDRFQSRYGRTKAPKIRSLTGKRGRF